MTSKVDCPIEHGLDLIFQGIITPSHAKELINSMEAARGDKIPSHEIETIADELSRAIHPFEIAHSRVTATSSADPC